MKNELGIPEDFFENVDFVLDLESCINDLKANNENLTEEELMNLLKYNIRVGEDYVTIYTERPGTKEIANYVQMEPGVFDRMGMVKQVTYNDEVGAEISESFAQHRFNNNQITDSMLKYKETGIESYSKGAQIINDSSFDELANYYNQDDSYWDEIQSNNEQQIKFGDRTLYVAKNTGVGVLSGVAGIGQAALTEAANEMNEGSNLTEEELRKNIISRHMRLSGKDMAVPDMETIILRAPEIGKNVKEIWDSDDKKFLGKLAATFNEFLTEGINSIPIKQYVDESFNIVGNVAPESGEYTMKANDAISKPIQNMRQDLYEEGQNYGKVTQTAGNVGQVIGNMAPSIATTIITGNPAVGLGVMGVSSKGQATQEALQKGADLNEAIKIGNSKGAIEVGTEMMFGGVNIFGKGALDDIVTRGIEAKVKNKVAQELAKKGASVSGEVIEETISDVLGTYIDQGTVDPNAEYTIDDWSDTAITTILSTLVLNGITNKINKTMVNNQNVNSQSENINEEININEEVNTDEKINAKEENNIEKERNTTKNENTKLRFRDKVKGFFSRLFNNRLKLSDAETTRNVDEMQQEESIKEDVEKTEIYVEPANTDAIIDLLNSELTMDNVVELLKIKRDFYEPSLANAIEYKIGEFDSLEEAYQILQNDEIANEIYAELNEDTEKRDRIEKEILENQELQIELAERRLQNTGNIDEYMAAYVEMIEKANRKKYNGLVNSINENSNSQTNSNQSKQSQSKVTQVTETQNKLYIEYDGLFKDIEKMKADLDKIQQKYATRDFGKQDMDVVLKDFDGQKFSIETAENMIAELQQLTPNVFENSSDLEKILKIKSSMNDNIKINNQGNNLSPSENFERGIFDGETTIDSFEDITKAALQLHGIESRDIKFGNDIIKQVQVDGKWYSLDSIMAEAGLEKSFEGQEQLPDDMVEQIHDIVVQNEELLQRTDYGRPSLLERIKSFFRFGQQQNQQETGIENDERDTIREQKINKASDMKITNCAPTGMINDQILWEIETWDRSDVKNQVDTSYVLLPNIGNPQQIFENNPETFAQIYQELCKNAKSQNSDFIGSIEYLEEIDGWSACLNESKEMQSVKAEVNNLIEARKQFKETQRKCQEIYDKYKQNESEQKLEKQVDLDEVRIQEGEEPAQQKLAEESQQHRRTKESIQSRQPQPDTIVISDLHSRLDRWELVKQELKKNPKLNVIILGDAMDRGQYGVELLLQIKELSDAGRVQYVPGNHDEFTYDYLRGKQDGKNALYNYGYVNLDGNKGKDTIAKLENFDQTVDNALKQGLITKKITIDELTEWMGNQPLQVITQQNGNNYALAHAFFDPKLYNYDPNFNLEKAYDVQMTGKNQQNSELVNRFKNTIWYRIENEGPNYASVNWPARYAMIVGHTPQKQGVNFKYVEGDPTKPMIYVDTGSYPSLGAFSLSGKIIENFENYSQENENMIDTQR